MEGIGDEWPEIAGEQLAIRDIGLISVYSVISEEVNFIFRATFMLGGVGVETQGVSGLI